MVAFHGGCRGECPDSLAHLGTRMPEVPRQNEKKYLTARTGVGEASEIFTTRFARVNRYIARNVGVALRARSEGFLAT